VRCCFETFLKDKLSPQQKPRRRRLGCSCGGERRELSRQDHDQRNRDLRQRSLDLVKGKKNLEEIVMNSGDFWRRKGSIKAGDSSCPKKKKRTVSFTSKVLTSLF
jgi:hypothetical protein